MMPCDCKYDMDGPVGTRRQCEHGCGTTWIAKPSAGVHALWCRMSAEDDKRYPAPSRLRVAR